MTLFNYELGKALLEICSLFFAYNNFKYRSRGPGALGISTPENISETLYSNQKILLQYFLTLDEFRAPMIFNPGVLHQCTQSVESTFTKMKYLKKRAETGIVCTWEALNAKPNGMWVHHFMVYQSLHQSLMIKSLQDGFLCNSDDYSFEFYGGSWENFFHFDDSKDDTTAGSRISWLGRGIE